MFHPRCLRCDGYEMLACSLNNLSTTLLRVRDPSWGQCTASFSQLLTTIVLFGFVFQLSVHAAKTSYLALSYRGRLVPGVSASIPRDWPIT